MTGAKDEVIPDGKWEFGAKETDAFEDMLERSIPMYGVMRQLVADLAADVVPRGNERQGVVVDLGSSRGGALAPLVDRLGNQVSYHAVEASEPMLAALRQRWPPDKAGEHGVSIHPFDLRTGYPPVPSANATLCVLTLQFTPIEHRQRILRDIYRHTAAGGALILVEKVLGSSAEVDALLTRRYFALKDANGYSPEQIERKRLSLQGVLVPVTAKWNEELLRTAGFRDVDCVWRWGPFAGWVALRNG
jgi:tRNA (cmo5U34)-methyltransferase